MRCIAENDCIIGTPTRFESEMVIHSRAGDRHLRDLRQILCLNNVSTIDFTAEHSDTSQSAFERYGKGRGHPARLNFGDCMAYAVARVANAPLLFKGNDFGQTDILPAYSP